MPDTTDVPIPLPPDGSGPGGGTDPDNGEEPMGAVPAEIHEQALSRMSGANSQAYEHFVTFGKILDLNYEMDRKVVSLVQSLGVREVTSQAGHTGIPLAGGLSGTIAGKPA